MGYIQGESRGQSSLFPLSLDELIPEVHPVRVLDAYVQQLDLLALGFTKAQPSATGRPAYDPADLLKLYLYGYFQRIRSSRRLEAECVRNVELMWLLGRLAPDFKTIADFRRDNGEAFSAVCRAFVQFCRQAGLIKGELVGIDGSKFQAVASKRRYATLERLKRQEEALEKRISQYLAELEASDQAEQEESVDRSAIQQALAVLQGQREKNQALQSHLAEHKSKQLVAGEEEARMMRSPQGVKVAYNVQSAVDAEHYLILHHEVTQDGSDNQQLLPVATAAKRILQQDTLEVTADAGYSNGEQFEACEQSGITAYVPLNRSVNNQGDGQYFDRTAFVFVPLSDSYQCPAGKTLQLKQLNKGSRIYAAAAEDCSRCPLKAQCAKAERRFITRHAHEEAFDRMQKRMAAIRKW